MTKPSGSIRWSGVPVATQRRPIEPVFGGISGATRTTCTRSAERHETSADGKDEPLADPWLGVPEELVVGGAQEARLVPAALHAAVEDVFGADPERRRI